MSKNAIKLLILSDIHGDIRSAAEAVKRQPSADMYIFLGDGVSDMVYVLPLELRGRLVMVRGNCDTGGSVIEHSLKKTEILSLGGHRILLTHGDLYGVKYGEEGLYRLAETEGCDIILFGHTHRPHQSYRDGVYLFNPGSIAGGLGLSPGAGLLTLDGDSVLFSHMNLEPNFTPSPFLF